MKNSDAILDFRFWILEFEIGKLGFGIGILKQSQI
jgi:hypothetical protein